MQAAAFVANTKFRNIPEGAVKKAKDAIHDCYGVTLAAKDAAAATIISDYISEQSCLPKATVLGLGIKSSSENAAFANGVLAHTLDYDDLHVGSGGHISCVLLPVILALGEEREASGADILTAYIVGFEIICRLGRQISRQSKALGFHTTSLWGPVGAAAAAASLMKLDIHHTRMALAIAASCASGLAGNFGSMTKGFHCGSSARAGLVAAKLAQKGFTGASDILERDRGFITTYSQAPAAPDAMNTLGKAFALADGVEFRLYPGRPESQSAIATALCLVKTQDVAPQDVEEIIYETSKKVPNPANEEKFSIEYSMAAVILDRAAGVAQFRDEAVERPEARALMRKFTYAHPIDHGGPEGALNERIRLRLRDGREVSHRVDRPVGILGGEIDTESLVMKYRNCAGSALSPTQVEGSLELLRNLENLGNIADLIGPFSASRN